MPTRRGSEATTSITLLHGVGLSPTLFGDVVDLLDGGGSPDEAHGTGRAVHTPLRRGYRDADEPPSTTFDDLLADVAALVAAAAPTVLVGVSGGATLALAAAVAGLPGVVAVVAHEPLVGPLATSLHDLVTASADRLAASGAVRSPLGIDAEATAFVERLVGADVWARLPHAAHAFAARHAATIRDEVPLFVGWRPSRAELERCPVPVIIGTGELSGPARHEAAAVLASIGARSVVVPAAGHLAPWQHPQAFAEVVAACASAAASPSIDRTTSAPGTPTTEETP